MTNWIHDIEIKNFKSIRHTRVEDCRRINVFIGYPNVGKSNILEALSLGTYLRPSSSKILFKDLCRYKEFSDLFYDGNRREDIEISFKTEKISIEYYNADELIFRAKFMDGDEGKDNKDSGYQSNKRVSSSSLEAYTINRDGVLKREGEVKFDSKFAIRKFVFKPWVLSPDESRDMPELNHPNGENLSTILRYNPSLRKEFGELLSDYNLKLIFDENGNMVAQKLLDEYTAFQFPYGQIADTLQRLVFHKAAIVSNNKSTLLFEEPEAHMFPPYVSKFTSDVMYDDNENQFFIATHSPVVVNDFMENLKSEELSIYAVGYKKQTGETEIRRLSESELDEIYQYGIDLFFNLERFLESEQQ